MMNMSGIPGPTERKSIYVVDGDADAAAALAALLDGLGHAVLVLPDNASLRSALSRNVPDVAIVNVDSVRLDWRKTAVLLRAMAPRRQLRLLALTAWGLGDYDNLLRALGYDVCLAQPVDAGQLCLALGLASPAPGTLLQADLPCM